MQDQSLLNITPAYFRSCFPDAPCVGFGEDFYILDAKLNDSHDPMNRPCRFDGFMVFYCISGSLKMSVNLTDVEISKGMVFINIPGNIIRINDISDVNEEEVRYVCMALSKEFFQSLNVEVCKLFNEGISMLQKPVILLSERDFDLTRSLVRYMITLLRSDASYKKEAVLSALSSLFYILMGAWTNSSSNAGTDVDSGELSNRSKVIFDKFMRLVMEYHTQYRNVGFYADQLCLTPKYLSKLIKNATGRSAPEWIDSYVILEAKNLLKYSGTTIKEIVFKLNFPNQSVFYKFFKAHTGMTPTEYRNS
jgi:AraC-like DNA-binding protein